METGSLSKSTSTPFFSPTGVAVIGASQDPTKLGYGLARNLVQSNFRGAIYFVNPHGGEIFSRKMYQNILEVPDPVDLAILLIPAATIPKALEECGERGLKAAIIGSGGFRETGSQGRQLEMECLNIARSFQMRLMGPNCIGLLDTHLPLDATFLPPPGPLPGDVAFVSHSGAICAAVIDWARGQSFGLSRLVSLGNQLDINETDILAPLLADPFTRVITLYLEGVSEGRRFVQEASRVTKTKPVIALKVGRFASGQRAVASHTGALAGEEKAYNAAFRRAGVIRAETSQEMFDWARALAWCPSPRGRSVAVLTNAGGPGVTAADALESNQMQLAVLGEATLSGLGELLPPAASLHNPIDMLASASPEQYARGLRLLLDDPAVDSVMLILPPPPMYTAGAVAKAVIPVIHQSKKPVVIALMGERLIQEAVEHFRAARVPEYRFPEQAASALAVLVERAEYLARASEPLSECCQEASDQVRSLLQPFLNLSARPKDHPVSVNLPVELLADILTAYGIPTLPFRLARSPQEAAAIASEMGFPLVMKIASPDILHKSDVNGVLLNLVDEKAVIKGFAQVVESVRELEPAAHIHGVTLQPMLSVGPEVILGAVRDVQFGALMMFGSGGIEVEGMQDVAFALAPMTQEEADYLLDNTWAGRRLFGYRNLPPADHLAVKDILLRLGQLAADFPEMQEIEINPLRVFNAGKGAYALDMRARFVLDHNLQHTRWDEGV